MSVFDDPNFSKLDAYVKSVNLLIDSLSQDLDDGDEISQQTALALNDLIVAINEISDLLEVFDGDGEGMVN